MSERNASVPWYSGIGVLTTPGVGDLGSKRHSGVLSTKMGVLVISVEGERGSNSNMRVLVFCLGGVHISSKCSSWSIFVCVPPMIF